MTNQQLCGYLFTQDPDAEVTAWIEGKIYSIVDIHDTELILKLQNKE